MKRKLSFLLALLMLLQVCAYILPGTVQAATVGSGKCGPDWRERVHRLEETLLDVM